MSNSWTSQDVEYLRENYPTEPISTITDHLDRSERAVYVKANRLGLSRSKSDVIRAKIQREDPSYPQEDFSWYVVGLVDGEGSFTCHNGTHILSVQMKEEQELLQKIRDYMGVGTYKEFPRRGDTYTGWTVKGVSEIGLTVIPFFDHYELQGRKKHQYAEWRESFVSEWPDYRDQQA